MSGPVPEPDQDSASLESALRSFLSTAPEGLARCRRNLPPVEGSPSDRSPQALKPAGPEATKQRRPEKKQPKLQKEEVATPENKKEAEKMREMTRKVLRYQSSKSSLDGDRGSGTPRRSERPQVPPATPSTPRPRTRDFFFANNGDMGSPWTILSPFVNSQRNIPERNRQALQRRLSTLSGGDDLDDGVWETDEGNCLPNQDSQTSPSVGSASLPESPHQRAVSQGPILRSVSMDETRRSPASGFRLGDLFQRSMSQRSYSSGSRTENAKVESAGVFPLHRAKARNHVEGQVSSSGLISFFRRIGGRSKPGDVEEQHFKGSNS